MCLKKVVGGRKGSGREGAGSGKVHELEYACSAMALYVGNKATSADNFSCLLLFLIHKS